MFGAFHGFVGRARQLWIRAVSAAPRSEARFTLPSTGNGSEGAQGRNKAHDSYAWRCWAFRFALHYPKLGMKERAKRGDMRWRANVEPSYGDCSDPSVFVGLPTRGETPQVSGLRQSNAAERSLAPEHLRGSGSEPARRVRSPEQRAADAETIASNCEEQAKLVHRKVAAMIWSGGRTTTGGCLRVHRRREEQGHA